VVVANQTSPTLDIGANNNGTDLQFGISFVDIQEITEDGTVVVSYPLNIQNYTLVGFPQTQMDGTVAMSYTYNATLPNFSNISIYLTEFTNATTVYFANQSIAIGQNGIKYAMGVSNWPFESFRNKLKIHVRSDIQDDACRTIDIGNDGDTLRYLKINVGGVSLYGKFAEYALIDEEARAVQYTFETATNLVAIIVPHFWTGAEFDPNFQVLVDNKGNTGTLIGQCDSKVVTNGGVSGAVLGGTIGGVVGAAALIGSILLFLRKKQQRKTKKRLTMSKPRSSTPMLHQKESKAEKPLNSSPLYSGTDNLNPLYMDEQL
jgi:hypothetical protein